MCGDSPDPPQPTDPNVTAAAQQKLNLQTTSQNQAASNVSQITPWGASTYYQTGIGPNGIPTYTNVQQLTPAQATLLALQQQGSGLAGGAASNLLRSSFDQYSTPPDLTGGNGLTERLLGRETEYLSPYFKTQGEQLDTQLRNQGIMPGTPAYNNQVRELQRNQNNAITGFLAQAEPMAFGQAAQQYQLPLQTATGLESLNQVMPPNTSFISTPNAAGAPADLVGATAAADNARMQAYQAQVSQQNNMMSGLFGLGAAGIKAISDRRAKRDVVRVGSLFDGVPVYLFRYIDAPQWHIGLMAQDVETYAPDAVAEVSGVKMVDYMAATARAKAMGV